jgi:hypothetical protein
VLHFVVSLFLQLGELKFLDSPFISSAIYPKPFKF